MYHLGQIIFNEAKSLGYLPKDMAKLHKRSLKRIYDAKNGKAPQLLEKINKRLQYLRGLKK